MADHPSANFLLYSACPVVPERTPAPGTLSSATAASRQKRGLILGVCVRGISEALRTEFAA